MTRRTQRRREIERLFAVRESEGLSLRQLADRSGIPVGTLSWWSHRLRQVESSGGFAEVGVIEVGDVVRDSSESVAPDLVLRHPGGVVVEVRGRLADRIVDGVLERIERWS